MAFKMKGSPMNRNFNVGSPVKQTYDENDTDTRGLQYRSKISMTHGEKLIKELQILDI